MRRILCILALVLTIGGMQPAAAGDVLSATSFSEPLVIPGGPIPRAGDIVSMSAYLKSDSQVVSGAPVTLQVKRYDQDVFHDLVTLPTDDNGRVTVNLKPRVNFKSRWVFAGNGAYAASSTAARVWGIASRASLNFSDTTPAVGQEVVVSGRTWPNKAGHTIRVRQGWFGSDVLVPTLLGTTTVKPNGRYRLRVRFATAGRTPVFVQVSRGHGNTIGYSDTRRVRVR